MNETAEHNEPTAGADRVDPVVRQLLPIPTICRTLENMKLCAHVMREGNDKDILTAFCTDLKMSVSDIQEACSLLQEWLYFSNQCKIDEPFSFPELFSLQQRTKDFIGA